MKIVAKILRFHPSPLPELYVSYDTSGNGQFKLAGKKNMMEIEKEINRLMMHQPKNE